jgi:hypothetical protein
MATAAIKLTPGLDVEQTPTFNAAGYNELDFGRFKAGLFQKIGGWEKYFTLALNGQGRAMHAFKDSNQIKRLIVGTTVELDMIANDVLTRLTPQQLVSDFAPDFSTTNGSATVEIDDPNIANVTTFDCVEFLTPISVGGLILSGQYRIAARTGTTTYTIIARANATATVANGGAVPTFDSTADSSSIDVTLADHAQVADNIAVFPVSTTVGGVDVVGKKSVTAVASSSVFSVNVETAATSTATEDMNGGLARIKYYIANVSGVAGIGYGLGGYGLGGYGLGGGGGSDQTGTPITTDGWTLDNLGDLLLSCPLNGGIYYWLPQSGFTNAQLLLEGPLYNTGMFVSMAAEQILAYGASINAWDPTTQSTGVAGIGVYQNPLLIAWPDVSNIFDWDPQSGNQAGNFPIPNGSEIIAGAATKNRNVYWTDLDFWTQQYIGPPDVYSPNKTGTNCGIIGQHAWASQSDAIFWMGKNNFYGYAGGGVQVIPCTIWDDVFQDIDRDAEHLSICASNSDFSEIWWFYPSEIDGFGYPSRWAKYNVVEQTWDGGQLDRLAWIDRSILGNPVGISADGIVFAHEVGNNNDGQPIISRFKTGNFALNEGEDFVTVDRIYPDFKWGEKGNSENAQISFTVFGYQWAGDPNPTASGPFVVTKSSPFIVVDPPVRARMLALEVASEDVDSFWRLGLVRFRYSTTGKRP